MSLVPARRRLFLGPIAVGRLVPRRLSRRVFGASPLRAAARLATVALAAQLVWASGLRAQEAPEIVDATAPERLAQIARAYGRAELSVDSRGDPRIDGMIEGSPYWIGFHGCADGAACKTVRFYTWSTVTALQASRVPAWNAKTRFAKAYVDKDGDVIVEMDVNLTFGVTARNFDDTVDWWRVKLAEFRREVMAVGGSGAPAPSPKTSDF